MRVITLISIVLLYQHVVSAQSKQEQAVLNVSQKKFEWLIQKKADSLSAMLDEQVVYVHSSGWSQSKQEILDDMISGKLVYKSVEVREAGVRLYDKAAVVVGTGRFSGNREGNEFEVELGYTEVYVWKDKKWMLVSRHANRLP